MRLWNYHKGKCLRTYSGHRNSKFCCFADFVTVGDSQLVLVSGSEDGKAYLHTHGPRTGPNSTNGSQLPHTQRRGRTHTYTHSTTRRLAHSPRRPRAHPRRPHTHTSHHTQFLVKSPSIPHTPNLSLGAAQMRIAALLLAACAPVAAFHLPSAPKLASPKPAVARHDEHVRCMSTGTRGDVVRGVGPGRELPAPSGINTLPQPLQAAIVIAILAGIGALTAALAGPAFDAVRGTPLWNLSRPTWPILGFIYLAAGIAHFTEADGFENITPPNGTWGIWYTPFSPRANVLWTGVVEIFGGAWMLLGGGVALAGVTLPPAFGPVTSDAALTLFLLTALVTPANIYALTHGANFPLDLETPPTAHAVRLGFQAVLLAMLCVS